MGLLDSYLDDPQQAGLLNAAAQMLAASGPSTMPRSFGQVLASGLGGYQQGVGLADQRAQQAQLRQLNDLKIRDSESDLKNQDMLRARQAQIQAELMGNSQAQAQSSPSPSSTPMGGSIMAGMGAPMPSWMPQPATSAADSAPYSPSAPVNPNEAAAARLMQEAQVYAKHGDFDGANKRYEAAIKLQPKYSTDFRQGIGADGKLHNYVLADNGTWKDTGLGVKADMKQLTLGDRIVFADSNAMKDGQTYAMGQSPDSKASNALGWANYNLSKSNSEKPTFSQDAGGFVYAPTKDAPTGRVVAPQGFTPKQQNAPVEFTKSATGLVELQKALNNYEQVIKDSGGTRVLPSSEKGAKLKAAFTSVQMGLKNAMELGALAGPDIELLNGMLADPTSTTGMIYGPKSIAKQIEQTRAYLGNRTDALEKVFGRPVPKVDAPKADNGWSITKVN